jgi:hypothetical protein
MAACLCASLAHNAAADSVPEDALGGESDELLRSTLVTTIGMEGTYLLRHEGPSLEVETADENSPLRLRIASIYQDGAASLYELRYIGNTPGQYDLWDQLRQADGQPIHAESAALVGVRELLPPDHDGTLEVLSPPPLSHPLRYKLLLVTIGTLWLVPAVWYLLCWTTRGIDSHNSNAAADTAVSEQLRPDRG